VAGYGPRTGPSTRSPGERAPTLGMIVEADHTGRDGDPDWTWPPYAADDPALARFVLDDWAPPSVVRRPWVRVGRWTLLYRRP
jgi:hypothetical protein